MFTNLQAFRKAREFFNQKSIPIFAGLSLDKKPVEGRDARSSENILSENKIEASEDVESRSNAIQSYVANNLANFVNQRSLSVNLVDAARSLMGFDSTAEEVIEVEEDVPGEEGRSKKKKVLKKVKKSILPLLLAIKMKVAVLAVITFFGIALIAKKALLASLISLAISGFIGLKKLLAKKSHHYVAEEVPYHGGWSSGGGWDYHGDSHGAYSSPVAQHLAYSGHKASNR